MKQKLDIKAKIICLGHKYNLTSGKDTYYAIVSLYPQITAGKRLGFEINEEFEREIQINKKQYDDYMKREDRILNIIASGKLEFIVDEKS